MNAALRQFILQRLWQGTEKRIRYDQPYVITINGSVGKTSTKEALAQILSLSGRPVVKTQGNMATDIGVPLSLLNFSDPPANYVEWLKALWRTVIVPKTAGKHPYYVLEFSSDKLGDTAFLNSHIKSQVAVLTSLLPVHIEGYGSEKVMVEDTLELLNGVQPGGYAVLNADDSHQRQQTSKLPVLWYGLAKDSPPKRTGIWGYNVAFTDKGIRFDVAFPGGSSVDGMGSLAQHLHVQTTLLGRHQLYPLLAAASVGYQEGIPLPKLKKALEEYQVPAGRGRIIAGKKQMTIIDDTANSSPEAVKAGLAMLRPFARERRIVAILGTMNELGHIAERAHEEIAEAAAKQTDFLIAVGKFGERMVKAAQKAGMPSMQAMSFHTPEQLMGHLSQMVSTGDVVYVKASQNGMYLERIIKLLMAKPQQASQLLVRQSAFWRKKV